MKFHRIRLISIVVLSAFIVSNTGQGYVLAYSFEDAYKDTYRAAAEDPEKARARFIEGVIRELGKTNSDPNKLEAAISRFVESLPEGERAFAQTLIPRFYPNGNTTIPPSHFAEITATPPFVDTLESPLKSTTAPWRRRELVASLAETPEDEWVYGGEQDGWIEDAIAAVLEKVQGTSKARDAIRKATAHTFAQYGNIPDFTFAWDATESILGQKRFRNKYSKYSHKDQVLIEANIANTVLDRLIPSHFAEDKTDAIIAKLRAFPATQVSFTALIHEFDLEELGGEGFLVSLADRYGEIQIIEEVGIRFLKYKGPARFAEGAMKLRIWNAVIGAIEQGETSVSLRHFRIDVPGPINRMNPVASAEIVKMGLAPHTVGENNYMIPRDLIGAVGVVEDCIKVVLQRKLEHLSINTVLRTFAHNDIRESYRLREIVESMLAAYGLRSGGTVYCVFPAEDTPRLARLKEEVEGTQSPAAKVERPTSDSKLSAEDEARRTFCDSIVEAIENSRERPIISFMLAEERGITGNCTRLRFMPDYGRDSYKIPQELIEVVDGVDILLKNTLNEGKTRIDSMATISYMAEAGINIHYRMLLPGMLLAYGLERESEGSRYFRFPEEDTARLARLRKEVGVRLPAIPVPDLPESVVAIIREQVVDGLSGTNPYIGYIEILDALRTTGADLNWSSEMALRDFFLSCGLRLDATGERYFTQRPGSHSGLRVSAIDVRLYLPGDLRQFKAVCAQIRSSQGGLPSESSQSGNRFAEQQDEWITRDNGARIHRTAVVINSEIGANARIDKNSVIKNAEIKAGAHIRNSVVKTTDDTDEWAYGGDSDIVVKSERAVIGKGTKVVDSVIHNSTVGEETTITASGIEHSDIGNKNTLKNVKTLLARTKENLFVTWAELSEGVWGSGFRYDGLTLGAPAYFEGIFSNSMPVASISSEAISRLTDGRRNNLFEMTLKEIMGLLADEEKAEEFLSSIKYEMIDGIPHVSIYGPGVVYCVFDGAPEPPPGGILTGLEGREGEQKSLHARNRTGPTAAVEGTNIAPRPGHKPDPADPEDTLKARQFTNLAGFTKSGRPIVHGQLRPGVASSAVSRAGNRHLSAFTSGSALTVEMMEAIKAYLRKHLPDEDEDKFDDLPAKAVETALLMTIYDLHEAKKRQRELWTDKSTDRRIAREMDSLRRWIHNMEIALPKYLENLEAAKADPAWYVKNVRHDAADLRKELGMDSAKPREKPAPVLTRLADDEVAKLAEKPAEAINQDPSADIRNVRFFGPGRVTIGANVKLHNADIATEGALVIDDDAELELARIEETEGKPHRIGKGVKIGHLYATNSSINDGTTGHYIIVEDSDVGPNNELNPLAHLVDVRTSDSNIIGHLIRHSVGRIARGFISRHLVPIIEYLHAPPTMITVPAGVVGPDPVTVEFANPMNIGAGARIIGTAEKPVTIRSGAFIASNAVIPPDVEIIASFVQGEVPQGTRILPLTFYDSYTGTETLAELVTPRRAGPVSRTILYRGKYYTEEENRWAGDYLMPQLMEQLADEIRWHRRNYKDSRYSSKQLSRGMTYLNEAYLDSRYVMERHEFTLGKWHIAFPSIWTWHPNQPGVISAKGILRNESKDTTIGWTISNNRVFNVAEVWLAMAGENPTKIAERIAAPGSSGLFQWRYFDGSLQRETYDIIWDGIEQHLSPSVPSWNIDLENIPGGTNTKLTIVSSARFAETGAAERYGATARESDPVQLSSEVRLHIDRPSGEDESVELAEPVRREIAAYLDVRLTRGFQDMLVSNLCEHLGDVVRDTPVPAEDELTQYLKDAYRLKPGLSEDEIRFPLRGVTEGYNYLSVQVFLNAMDAAEASKVVDAVASVISSWADDIRGGSENLTLDFSDEVGLYGVDAPVFRQACRHVGIAAYRGTIAELSTRTDRMRQSIDLFRERFALERFPGVNEKIEKAEAVLAEVDLAGDSVPKDTEAASGAATTVDVKADVAASVGSAQASGLPDEAIEAVNTYLLSRLSHQGVTGEARGNLWATARDCGAQLPADAEDMVLALLSGYSGLDPEGALNSPYSYNFPQDEDARQLLMAALQAANADLTSGDTNDQDDQDDEEEVVPKRRPQRREGGKAPGRRKRRREKKQQNRRDQGISHFAEGNYVAPQLAVIVFGDRDDISAGDRALQIHQLEHSNVSKMLSATNIKWFSRRLKACDQSNVIVVINSIDRDDVRDLLMLMADAQREGYRFSVIEVEPYIISDNAIAAQLLAEINLDGEGTLVGSMKVERGWHLTDNPWSLAINETLHQIRIIDTEGSRFAESAEQPTDQELEDAVWRIAYGAVIDDWLGHRIGAFQLRLKAAVEDSGFSDVGIVQALHAGIERGLETYVFLKAGASQAREAITKERFVIESSAGVIEGVACPDDMVDELQLKKLATIVLGVEQHMDHRNRDMLPRLINSIKTYLSYMTVYLDGELERIRTQAGEHGVQAENLEAAIDRMSELSDSSEGWFNQLEEMSLKSADDIRRQVQQEQVQTESQEVDFEGRVAYGYLLNMPIDTLFKILDRYMRERYLSNIQMVVAVIYYGHCLDRNGQPIQTAEAEEHRELLAGKIEDILGQGLYMPKKESFYRYIAASLEPDFQPEYEWVPDEHPDYTPTGRDWFENPPRTCDELILAAKDGRAVVTKMALQYRETIDKIMRAKRIFEEAEVIAITTIPLLTEHLLGDRLPYYYQTALRQHIESLAITLVIRGFMADPSTHMPFEQALTQAEEIIMNQTGDEWKEALFRGGYGEIEIDAVVFDDSNGVSAKNMAAHLQELQHPKVLGILPAATPEEFSTRLQACEQQNVMVIIGNVAQENVAELLTFMADAQHREHAFTIAEMFPHAISNYPDAGQLIEKISLNAGRPVYSMRIEDDLPFAILPWEDLINDVLGQMALLGSRFAEEKHSDTLGVTKGSGGAGPYSGKEAADYALMMKLKHILLRSTAGPTAKTAKEKARKLQAWERDPIGEFERLFATSQSSFSTSTKEKAAALLVSTIYEAPGEELRRRFSEIFLRNKDQGISMRDACLLARIPKNQIGAFIEGISSTRFAEAAINRTIKGIIADVGSVGKSKVTLDVWISECGIDDSKIPVLKQRLVDEFNIDEESALAELKPRTLVRKVIRLVKEAMPDTETAAPSHRAQVSSAAASTGTGFAAIFDGKPVASAETRNFVNEHFTERTGLITFNRAVLQEIGVFKEDGSDTLVMNTITAAVERHRFRSGFSNGEDQLCHQLEYTFTIKWERKGTVPGTAETYIRFSVKSSSHDRAVALGDIAVDFSAHFAEDDATQPTTILLVEDDEGQRRKLVRGFTREGYKVIEAVNRQDALRKLSALPTPPDLMATDLNMPDEESGRNDSEAGAKLAEEAEKRYPQMKTILTSAGMMETHVGLFKDAPGVDEACGKGVDVLLSKIEALLSHFAKTRVQGIKRWQEERKTFADSAVLVEGARFIPITCPKTREGLINDSHLLRQIALRNNVYYKPRPVTEDKVIPTVAQTIREFSNTDQNVCIFLGTIPLHIYVQLETLLKELGAVPSNIKIIYAEASDLEEEVTSYLQAANEWIAKMDLPDILICIEEPMYMPKDEQDQLKQRIHDLTRRDTRTGA